MSEQPATTPGIKVTMLLCDAAQELGGKLYILGAGWSRVAWVGVPLNMAVAIKLLVPWHMANQPQIFRLQLVTEDGQVVMMGASPVAVEGNLEVGRPPGLRQGSHLDAAMAITMTALSLSPGGYRWELLINDEPRESVPFEIVSTQPSAPATE